MAKSNVRDKLVAAGLELFHTKGYNACGVSDITDAAGVPKGSFYNHFKSKELLALAVLDLYQSFLDLNALQDSSKPPILRLRAHFQHYITFHVKWRFARGCLMGNFGAELSSQSPIIRKVVKKAFGRWFNGVASVLQEAKERGDIDRHHDPQKLARFLINAWEGVVIQSKVMRNTTPFEDFFAVIFDSFLKR
jgi:TetR/AcrR family transcriptional regulator, transcriptional repressor for nem operon